MTDRARGRGRPGGRHPAPAAVRVLGVDPGSTCTGWGVVGGDTARPRLVACGEIRLPAGSPLAVRLHRLRVELEAVIRRIAPTSAAVESPFHGANARSALHLAHARGVILAVLGGCGVPVSEYSPATVKKSVTGSGRAEKVQVQSMVQRLVRDEPRAAMPADVADAVAVALCHLSLERLPPAVRPGAAGRARTRAAATEPST